MFQENGGDEKWPSFPANIDRKRGEENFGESRESASFTCAARLALRVKRLQGIKIVGANGKQRSKIMLFQTFSVATRRSPSHPPNKTLEIQIFRVGPAPAQRRMTHSRQQGPISPHRTPL
jgi:hypothetical protein